ncbi:MAG: diaminopimelate decarboxylase [Chitinophagaceae bacterium]
MINNSLFSKEILIQAAGQFETPLYIYNATKISSQYKYLIDNFKDISTQFFYACKALSNVHILNYIQHIGMNIDCVSINEIKLALYAGFSPSKILFTSNNIEFSELEEAINIGTIINIDSLYLLEEVGKKYRGNYPVLVRINPNIKAGGNEHIATGHNKSKFGIPFSQFDKLVEIIKKYDIHIHGLHVHSGSEIANYGVFKQELELLFDLALKIPSVKILNLGGGFKVKYQDKDNATDIAALSKMVKKLTQDFKEHYHRDFEIWFEPGKFMVAESGVLLVKVVQVKQNPEDTFLGVNSGLNHLLRPMFYNAYHEIENISSLSDKKHIYTIVGNICETDDLGKNRLLQKTQPGDILAIYNAGAYGFEMANNYNSRNRPAEVFFLKNQLELIRNRESFEDILKQQATLPLPTYIKNH